jgi:FtsZ-binding cell division protein ZapB
MSSLFGRDAVQRIIMQVLGREEIEGLREAIKTEEESIRSLNSVMAGLGHTQAQIQATLTPFATTINSANDRIRQLEKSTRNYNNAILYGSYALQDFTSVQGNWIQRLNSIQNNIPQITMALGGTAGLAGAISITMVAFQLMIPVVQAAYNALQKFWGSAKDGMTEIERLQLKIKELEDKKVKLSIDYIELDKAKEHLKALEEALHAYDAALKERTHYEQAAGKEATELVRETYKGGIPKLTTDIEQQILGEKTAGESRLNVLHQQIADRQRQAARLAKEAAASGDALVQAQAQERIALIEEDIRHRESQIVGVSRELSKAAALAAGKLIAGIADGMDAGARKEMADRLRKLGQKGIAAHLERITPEGLMAEEAAEEEQESEIEERKQQIQRRDESRREREKKIDDMVKEEEHKHKKGGMKDRLEQEIRAGIGLGKTDEEMVAIMKNSLTIAFGKQTKFPIAELRKAVQETFAKGVVPSPEITEVLKKALTEGAPIPEEIKVFLKQGLRAGVKIPDTLRDGINRLEATARLAEKMIKETVQDVKDDVFKEAKKAPEVAAKAEAKAMADEIKETKAKIAYAAKLGREAKAKQREIKQMPKRQKEAYTQQVAGEIGQVAQQMGFPMTAAQAMAAAKKTVHYEDQQMNAFRATQLAMEEIYSSMFRLGARAGDFQARMMQIRIAFMQMARLQQAQAQANQMMGFGFLPGAN